MIAFTVFFAWLWCERQKQMTSNMTTKSRRSVQIQCLVFAILTFLPMFLINSLMKNVGTDYTNYYVYFQRIISGQNQEVDFTYKLICLILNKLGLGFQWVFVIYSAISYSLLIACIKKYSSNYAVSYLMFYLNGYFATLGLHQIRQFVAVMLVFLGYSYISSKDPLKYFVCIGLASAFHFTALIMIPFYWILGKKWRSSAYVIGIIILLPFNLFYSEIMTWLFATFLPRYLNTNFVTRGFQVTAMYLGLILFPLVISILYEKMGNSNMVFKNCMYISSMIVLVGSWLPEYKRFVYYFFIPSIVYVPQLLEEDQNRIRKWIFYSLLLAFYLWYFVMTFDVWSISPYQSIFS